MRIDTLDCEIVARIEAPFDSGDHPKSVFIMGSDVDNTTCDNCGIIGADFPGLITNALGIPAAMFKAALYCADCQAHSYDENDGHALWTLTGNHIFKS